MQLNLQSEYKMTVFQDLREFDVLCWPRDRVGSRLIAVLSGSAPKGAMVRIDSGAALLFGEVLDCWRENDTAHALIELQSVLQPSAMAWQV